MKTMITSFTTGLFLLGVVFGVAAFSAGANSEENQAKKRAFLISHFHYDPVWTNSQAGETMRAFSIMNQNLEFAASEPRFKFVLSEIDYLRPYWDAYPSKRAPLLALIADERVELTGGYSEPDEAAVGGEALIRNFALGKLYKESLFGGKVLTVAQHDVFGHAVQLPQILLKTGHENVQFERGNLTDMPQDFLWLAPDGNSILARQQGYGGSAGETLIGGRDRAKYPFTNNAVFMSGGDFSAPDRNLLKFTKKTKDLIVRVGTHKDFFDAEREDIKARNLIAPEISRDHTPLLPGCYSSRIDTKLANRWAEITIVDAEKFSAIASIFYNWKPDLDKAWRLLLWGQHHDALTGSDTENVNLDLLTQWRESLTIASGVRDEALSLITEQINTKSKKQGVPVVIFNSLNWDRKESVRIQTALPSAWKGFKILDSDNKEQAFQFTTPAAAPFKKVDVLIMADVPSMGYATYRIVESAKMPYKMADAVKPKKVSAVSAESDFFRVKVDPAKGGGIISLYGKKEKKEYIDSKIGVGNEIFAIKENNAKVEGPWSIHSTGQAWGTSKYPAEEVWVEDGPVAARIMVKTAPRVEKVKIFDGSDKLIETRSQEVLCRMLQEIIIYKKIRRIDFRTHLLDYKETDFLYKVGFPASVKGALPVFGERFAAVGREKNGEDFLFYDFWREPGVKKGREYPADTWMDYTSPARLEFTDAAGKTKTSMSLAQGEIIVHDNNPAKEAANKLARALVRKGVTSTITADKKQRTNEYYGFRVSIGAGDNAYSAIALKAAPAEAIENFRKLLDSTGHAFLLVQPSDSVTATINKRNIPVLIVEAKDSVNLDKAISALAGQLEKHGNLTLPQNADAAGIKDTVEPFGVAILNRGHAGNSVEFNGTITMTLMRSSTGWPSGRLYSTNLETENWNHVYEYALLPHAGDWRAAKTYRAGAEFNHPLYPCVTKAHAGKLPAKMSFMSTPGTDAIVSALKPAGFEAEEGKAINSNTPILQLPAPKIAVRFYNPTGFPSVGELKFFTPLASAQKTNMLEKEEKPVSTTKDGIAVNPEPFSIDTYLLTTNAISQIHKDKPQPLSSSRFVRYWETSEGVAQSTYPKLSATIEPGGYSEDRKEMTAIVTVVADKFFNTISGPGNAARSSDGEKIRIYTPPGVTAEPDIIEFKPDLNDIAKPVSYKIKFSGIDLSRLSKQYISVKWNALSAPADYLTFKDWKVFSGDPQGAETPDFDDSSWETLPLARFWSRGVAAPVTWYRRRMVIPKGMGDMQLFFDRPAGAVATAFINGDQVQKSADGLQVSPLISSGRIEYGKEILVAVRVEYTGDEPVTGTAFHGSETMFNNDLWRIENPKVKVKKGGGAKMTVFFRNPFEQPLDFVAVLSSPIETWDVGGPHSLIEIGPASRYLNAGPLKEVPATFDITVPPDADPGRHLAAVKFIYAGIPVYSGIVEIVVEP